MKQRIIIIVSVILFFLLLLVGLHFILHQCLLTLLDRMFPETPIDGFTDSLVLTVQEDASVKIPENAEFIRGTIYSGKDTSTVLTFSIPYPSSATSAALFIENTLLLEPLQWQFNHKQPNREETDRGLPNMIGCFTHYVYSTYYSELHFSYPTDGKLYICLEFGSL